MPPDTLHRGLQETPPATPDGLMPFLVPATVAGPMCGVGTSTWRRLVAAGKAPKPLKVGGRVLWRAGELAQWIEAGCPGRGQWEAIRSAENKAG
jgi:predicted DNA-binding transcriptional regulator AlpA